jgi:single-strand DNA-binding protein
MNKAILIGNLASDPEIKTTTNGIAVANFTVAVNRTYTSANGEKEADFIRCVSFRNQAENIGRYIKKGSKVAVEGRIQTRSYDAQDGSKRYVTEIICDSVQFLDSRSGQDNNNGNYNNNSYGNNNYNNNYSNNNNNGYNQNQYQQPSMNTGRNQGFNNSPMNNNPYNKPQQNNDDFFDNQNSIDISEDDLPF